MSALSIPSPPSRRDWRRLRERAGAARLRCSGLARAVSTRRKLAKIYPEVEAGYGKLEFFGKESEREFTLLAESLADVSAQLGSLDARVIELERTLSDHDEERALSSAFNIYSRSVELVQASMELAISEEAQMEGIESRLLADREKFARNGMLFESLVTLIRVEATRVDSENGSVFAQVAADVSAMVKRMADVAGGAFGKIASVIADGTSGRDELRALQANLRKSADRSAAVLRAELERVQELLQTCAGMSRELLSLLGETKTATAQMVTSLQYQDIVRQQLEHVSVGFREIMSHMTDPSRPGRLKRARDLDLAYIHHAVRVQRLHLQTSRQSIEDAGREVMRRMDELLKVGECLLARFAKMEEKAAEAFVNCKMGELLRKETGDLVAMAGQGETTNQRVHRLVNRVEEFAQVFSQDIVQQEFDVKLIALNAEVAAARLGSAKALNRLAEETSRLSDETTELTLTVSAALERALQVLLSIKRSSAECRDNLDREKSALVADMSLVADKLTRLNERVKRHSSEVGRQFGAVRDEVGTILPNLRFPDLIEQCYGPVERLCDQLLACTADYAPAASLDSGAAARIDAHKEHYTMRSEREVHSLVLADSSNPPSVELAVPVAGRLEATVGAPAACPTNDLDGVELF